MNMNLYTQQISLEVTYWDESSMETSAGSGGNVAIINKLRSGHNKKYVD